MARRRLTLKRIDPWTVLKFGFVANLALLAIWLLGAGIVWFFVRQLELIEKVCEIAGDVGFVECGVNGGNLFRALLLLGLLGTVIQTGLLVFLAFLHNLIADLVGGISFTYTEEGGTTLAPSSRASAAARTTRRHEPVGAGAAAGASAAGASGSPPPPLGSERSGSRASSTGSSGSGASPGSEAGSSPPSGSREPGSAPTGPSGPRSEPSPSGQPRPQPSPGQPSRTDDGQSSSSRPERSDGGSDAGSPSEGGSQAGRQDSSSSERSGSSADWDLFGPRSGGSSGGSS